MARIVMKFGGTSVADLSCIGMAAEHVKAAYDRGDQIIVVVSAMSGFTNQMVDYVRQTSKLYDTREYDTVVSSGEQITAGLMALKLQEMGCSARSWLGWQLPIMTDEVHGKARILEIKTEQLDQRLNTGEIAVCAGFQGLSDRGRITTLGRGGSDTTAVALAAAFKADRCDIYTDVNGVYTADPRIVPKAQKLNEISHEEMLEMASQGAKVLQTRCVEMAMKHGVRLRVLSTFEKNENNTGINNIGTMVVNEDEIMEKQLVNGITHTKDETKITVARVHDKPGTAASLFSPLAQSGVNVDMIVQSVSADGQYTDMTFTVPTTDKDKTIKLIEELEGLSYDKLLVDSNVAKVSVVGVGMRSHAGVAQTMFQTLAVKGINMQAISTSEIKVTILIPAEYLELAVRSLHSAYGLDKE